MSHELISLAQLGWNEFFSAQIADADFADLTPVRVMAVHRGEVEVYAPKFDGQISSHIDGAKTADEYATVGDWVLVDIETKSIKRVLDRRTLFKRRAAGKENKTQLIAANVDTVFIMTACNGDFNLARLERYLVLAHEAGATPVIVLTKIDLCDNVQELVEFAQELAPNLIVKTINTKNEADVEPLLQWCQMGQTIALLGSSGVGKSTLVNTLSGSDDILTQINRRGDSKGRHTTTHRELHRLHTGAWLIDSPGMRELQLTEAEAGIEELFDDIEAIAAACKFGDCAHQREPGCQIKRALDDGVIDIYRLERWQKLKTEDMLNTLSKGEKRRKAELFGKSVKSALIAKKRSGK